jgi:hypothetical protein
MSKISDKPSNLSRLKGALQTTNETEQVADDTLVRLEEQKRQITKSKDKTADTNKELSLARRFINNMTQLWRG